VRRAAEGSSERRGLSDAMNRARRRQRLEGRAGQRRRQPCGAVARALEEGHTGSGKGKWKPGIRPPELVIPCRITPHTLIRGVAFII